MLKCADSSLPENTSWTEIPAWDFLCKVDCINFIEFPSEGEA